MNVGPICEEFTKTCENISKIYKFIVGLSKHVFTTQITHISTFSMRNLKVVHHRSQSQIYTLVQREEQCKTPTTGSNKEHQNDVPERGCGCTSTTEREVHRCCTFFLE